MTDEDFRRQYAGEFKQDERLTALDDRLRKYYEDTSDSVDNKTALLLFKDFKLWCFECGYTQEEVNYAKRNYKPRG